MQTFGAEHVLADQLVQRCQDGGRRADQVGERLSLGAENSADVGNENSLAGP
jgi:hypothetical protein